MERGRQAHYKLTSTIMLQLITRRGSASGSSDAKESMTWTHDGEISLSGSMTRQVCFTVYAAGEAVTKFVW
jgi:capping protein beta